MASRRCLACLVTTATRSASVGGPVPAFSRSVMAACKASFSAARDSCQRPSDAVSAMAASAPDPTLFKSGRQFAAWLGHTPRANSSGGKERQGGISKMGDSYLRRLLVVGATAVLRMARQRGREGWVGNLLERKKPKVAAVALANKTARIAWTLMARQEDYKPTAA